MEPAELAAGFSVEHLGRAPARYDEAQLLHWQAEAVRHATPERLWAWMGAVVHERAPPACRDDFIATVRPNIRFPADAAFWAERLFGEALTLSEDSRAVIAAAGSEFFHHALAAYARHETAYQSLVDDLKQSTGVKGKNLFMPLRAALTGETHGPELARILALLPPDAVRRRLQAWH
jgi:glutamyl-tRNA synthetase